MLMAVALGIAIATGRIYGGRLTRAALIGYVELMRGTPILLQLFVLYYGLAAAIRLPAWMAALLGLGLNYAAYESEIYRSALLAVPVGQLEAAKTLGFSDFQTLRLIRGPQALRLALAPMTNDFVALLKDSSLVSVLTVVELTKETQIFATNLGSWVIPGALCAALYLADVAAAGRPRARARAAMEVGRPHERAICSVIRGLELKRGGRVLVSGVNLEARPGELIALRGPSGSGKTTILRAIAGLDRFERAPSTSGTRGSKAAGRPIAPMLHRLRRSVGLVFQFHCLFEHMSALQNVCLAPIHVHGIGAGRRTARPRAAGAAWRRVARRALPRELSGEKRSGWRLRARWRWIRPCC